MSRFSRFALAALAASLIAPSSLAAKPQPEPRGLAALPLKAKQGQLAPGVVALVEGGSVSAEEFGRLLAQAAIKAKAGSFEGRVEVLLSEIDRRLMLKEALAAGVDRQALPARMIARRRRQLAGARKMRELLAQVTVRDDEVAARFKDPGDIVSYTVLLADTMEEAQKALARIRAGEDFAAVSAEVSIAPVSGGSVARKDVARGQTMYPPAVEDAVFRLTPGQISAPMEMPFGTLVVRFDTRRRLTQEETESARTNLRETMLVEKRERALEEAVAARRKQARVKIVRERYAGPDIPSPDRESWDLWAGLEAVRLVEIDALTLTLGDIFVGELDYKTFQKKADKDKNLREGIERALGEFFLAEAGRAAGYDKGPEIDGAVRAYAESLALSKHTWDLSRAVRKEKLDRKQALVFFEEHRTDYFAEPRLELWQILERREDEAKETLILLSGGRLFADLAKKRSVHDSAAKGGAMQPLGKAALAREFGDEGVAKLLGLARAGQMGPHLLRTTSGWHVVLIRRVLEPGQGDFEEVSEKVLTDFLYKTRVEAVRKHVLDLRNAATISIDVEQVRTTPLPAVAPSVHTGGGGAGPAKAPAGGPHGGKSGGGRPAGHP